MSLSKEDKKEIAEMIAVAMGNKLDTTENWGDNIQTKKLKCGIEIAMEDYREIDENGNEKTEFTFDEALEIEKKTNGKWRVPTIAEWLQIVVELAPNLDEDQGKIVQELGLLEPDNGCDFYWSSTVESSRYAYGLSYNSGELCPAARYYRSDGWSVRCVKNIEAKGGKECENTH